MAVKLHIRENGARERSKHILKLRVVGGDLTCVCERVGVRVYGKER